jgi:hypothetical protein
MQMFICIDKVRVLRYNLNSNEVDNEASICIIFTI